MTTFTRDEQKAVDALLKAYTAIEALGDWNPAQLGAIDASLTSVKNFITNRAITRANAEQYPPFPPVEESLKAEPNSVEVEGGDITVDPVG